MKNEPLHCAVWGAAASVPFTLVLVAMNPGPSFFAGLAQELALMAAVFSALGLLVGLIGSIYGPKGK